MIKILTLLGNNYGGCLQAVALQKILKEYDNVETINYDEYINKKFNIKKIIKDIIYFKRNVRFNNFRKKNLILTKEKNKLVDDLYSTYVVGSDQVWNPNNLSLDIRKNYYLSFVNDKKRKYSYAASIGDEILDKNNELDIVKMLKDFNRISVRETSSEKYLNEKYKLNVTSVLDPTMAVGKEYWDSLINGKYKEKGYILVYTLGMSENCNSTINKFSQKNNKIIIEIFYKKRFKNTKKAENDFGPLEFIEAVSNADFVLTNSFHGMVFSIIYHKEFYVITRKKMNSRIFDLLKKLELTDRIIKEENIDEILRKKTSKIDYQKIDKIIENEREKSLKFIQLIINRK